MKNKIDNSSDADQVDNCDDIYADGTYIKNNPTLHSEDSEYKFSYIHHLLKKCSFDGPKIKILDIGGGAGIISLRTCQMLAAKGYEVECYAFDLSMEMLLQQKSNNPYISLATSNFDQVRSNHFDITLMVDVIEHISDNASFADEVDQITNYIIYNIPIERTLFDLLRNIYMKRTYYLMQTASLGHLHFFSAISAKRFVRKHHLLVDWAFPSYSQHILESNFSEYVAQRSNRIRSFELILSRFIYRYMKICAPWIIQGSLFMLAKSRYGNHGSLNR
jgi:hypothetical protein